MVAISGPCGAAKPPCDLSPERVAPVALAQIAKGEPLSRRDLAERICSEEGKDIRDVRMMLDDPACK
jgi:hypothetical protein